MPFKTRKQKEAARERRFTFAANSLLTYKNIADKKPEIKSGAKHVPPLEESMPKDTFYVRTDLVKILFLSAFIILTQLVLWVLQTKSILKF